MAARLTSGRRARLGSAARATTAGPLLALPILLALAGPAAAGNAASVDRLEGIDTVVVVAMPDNFPIASISRADCATAQLVTRPDGSARETLHCQLSDKPTMIPEFQGHAPDQAFRNQAGPCAWTSDYWVFKSGEIVFASSVQYVVTPSGRLNIVADYPAERLVCE
jgi:hypothetical protein